MQTARTEIGTPRLEHDLLELLDSSDEPLGAVTLYYRLRDKHGVGQATVGRKLHELDFRGLTERHSFAGRSITAAGREHLQRLGENLRREDGQAALADSLSANDTESLLNVLETRRVLESYAAYLAASRGTSEDFAELRAIIRRNKEAVAAGESGDGEDAAFHDFVARASRNPVLENVVRLLRQYSAIAPVVASIVSARSRNEGVRYPDLTEIVEQLERRDPEGARDAMSRHIGRMADEFIRYVSMDDQTKPAEGGVRST